MNGVVLDVTQLAAVDLAGRTGGTSIQAPAAPPMPDQVQIRELDLGGALQILLAEARAALPLREDILPIPSWPGAGAGAPSPAVTTPQALVQLFLQALPAPAVRAADIWMAAVTKIEAAMLSGLDKGVDAVTQWRDVPPAVVDGVKETRAVVLAAVGDDMPNASWVRPEWLGLAPRMERYWRRRRRARRALSDPDPHWHVPDEDDTPPLPTRYVGSS